MLTSLLRLVRIAVSDLRARFDHIVHNNEEADIGIDAGAG